MTMRVPIDRRRVWERLQRLAMVGVSADGERHRSPYSPAHAEAVALVAAWLREAGIEPECDETGNLVGVLAGQRAGAGAIGLGSHLDTVPNAGAFDGALGVVAAVEVVQSLREAGVTPPRPIAAIAFADEEGNAFGIGVLSAQLWTGAIGVEALDTLVDAHGRTLRSHVEAFDVPGVPIAPRPRLAGYLELHVEQGPILHRDGIAAAAVEGIVGIDRTTVTLLGAANHAGTTPMDLRRDALYGGAELALAVRDLGRAARGDAVATVGVFEVSPGATNVIPGRVRMRVEIRALDATLLARTREQVEARASEIAARHGLEVRLEPWHQSAPVRMDPRAHAATRDGLQDAGLPTHAMPSWAGHDAKELATQVATGMLFVPSRDGVSHSPEEYTDPEACADGTQALLYAALRLAAHDELP